MPHANHINGDRRSSTDDGTQPGSSDDQSTASESSGSYQAGGTNPQQHDGYPAQVNGHPAHVNGAADSSRDMTQPEPSASEPLASDNTGLGEVGGATSESYHQVNVASNGVGHQGNAADYVAIDLSVRPWSESHISWLRQGQDHNWTRPQNLTRLSLWSSDFRTVLHFVYPRQTSPLAKAEMWQNLKNNIDATDTKVQRLILLTHDTDYKEELESIRGEIDILKQRLIARRFSLNATSV